MIQKKYLEDDVTWSKAARALLAFVAAGMFLIQAVAAQSFPDPKDEAALYARAKQEGKLVWYVSGPLEQLQAIARAFEKKYPGIKLELLRVVGVQQYQRVHQEMKAGRHNVDILHISDQPSMAALVDEGHIAEWKVPDHDRFADFFRIRNHAYSNGKVTIAIVYNVNKVTPEEVKLLESDWKAVLDPRFKGRFAATSMKCGTCYATLHMFLDEKYKSRFGVEFLRQVAAQKPAVYGEVLVGLDRVIAGEQDFTYWTWEGIALTKWQQGAPIRWIRPAPTPTLASSFQGISKYAPHPHAARLFQNWSMSEEGGLAIQNLYGSESSISGLADQRAVTREPWHRPVSEEYFVDFKRWDRDFHRDMDSWINILKQAR
jgi:iron(III) transport system substrate-binding protein